MTIAPIVFALFVFIALWLLWYVRSNNGVMSEFAESKGLNLVREDNGTLEQALNGIFAHNCPVGRRFSQIHDIIEENGAYLLRMTKVVGHGSQQNFESKHVAVFREVSSSQNAYFLVTPAKEVRFIDPKDPKQIEADPTFIRLKQFIQDKPPSETLSITLKKGRFLSYLKPDKPAVEKLEELEYLYRLAGAVR